MISMIACIGKKLEIGKSGGLAFSGRGELGYFKSVTMHHKVVMGYNTFRSLPSSLPGRECYLIASGDNLKLPNWIHLISDPISFLENCQNSKEEIFIIGGGSIYALALPYATNLYITEVDATCPNADTFFPKFNPQDYTKKFIESGAFDNGLIFSRYIYTKK